MSQYVAVYCETERRRQRDRFPWQTPWKLRRATRLGLCYARKVDGSWVCPCCGDIVRVVEFPDE